MHMIKKGQMISAGTEKISAAEQFYILGRLIAPDNSRPAAIDN